VLSRLSTIRTDLRARWYAIRSLSWEARNSRPRDLFLCRGHTLQWAGESKSERIHARPTWTQRPTQHP